MVDAKDQPATAADVREIVIGAIADFWEHKIYPEFQQVYQRLDGIDDRFNQLQGDLREVKDRVKNLEGDTPSRAELSNLDERVEQLEAYHID